ncbi:MAG: lysylphosphatidylglycerol synthase domain-containing protein, partial [Kofleriaceae bacterium]
MKGYARLVLFVLVFVALASAGIAWGVHASGVVPGDLGILWTLPGSTLLGLVAACLGLYGADMIRYRAFGAAIGEHVTWRAALDATVANFFFSWVTPGAALGAPAAIVMLGRRGVSWEGATLIAFGKSLTGTAVLVGLAFVALALGLGPALDRSTVIVLATGTGIFVALLLVPIIGALWPRRMLAGIDRFERLLARRWSGPRAIRIVTGLCETLRRAVERLAKLRERGAMLPLLLLVTHLLYLGVFVAIAVVLARAFGAESLPRAIGISTVYAAFTYVAPTPGGAGLSEAAATVFFGGILAPRRSGRRAHLRSRHRGRGA